MALTMTVDHVVDKEAKIHAAGLEKGTQVTILTMEPCFRTIFVSDPFSGQPGNIKPMPIQLPFPYVHFVIRYSQVAGGYLYRGLGGYGLGIYFTKRPLKRNVKICHSPTEGWNGIVCTNHAWDHKVFKTREKLFKTLIGFWMGTHHYMRKDDVLINSGHGSGYNFGGAKKMKSPPKLTLDDWQKMTLKEALAYDWHKCLYPLGIKPKYINKPIKL